MAKAKSSSPDPLTPAKCGKLLERVAAYHHQRFLDRPDGREFLVKVCGLRNLGLLRDVRVGYADGSLVETLPQDESQLAAFRALGVLDGKGHDALSGCVVFPVFDGKGVLVDLYGLRITDGKPRWLTQSETAVWNLPATRRGEHVLIVGTMLDALALMDRGMSGAYPCLGAETLNAAQLNALSKGTAKTATIVLPDTQTKRAALLSEQLSGIGIANAVALLPGGMAVNAFLCDQELSALQALLPRIEAASVAAPSMRCQRTENGVIVHVEDRCYEVKAFVRQGTQLKATIKARRDAASMFELHTLDLYSARSRDHYAATCAALFEVAAGRVRQDLDQVLEQLEAWQPDADPTSAPIVLSEADQALGLELLRAPNLLARIEGDLTTLGVTGEARNKQLAYLTAVSRLLDDPLSLLLQSRSAAGKSTLQGAVAALVPDEHKVLYTRMTDQALFYQTPNALKHKLLVLEEAEGLGGSAYSLRALQSSKQLAIATTSKDAMSGKLKTEHYVVHGPVAVLLTTTSASLDEETASRFLTATIDESAAMTARIFDCQREADTLAGFQRQLQRQTLVRQHQAAQRLLEPLAVINPFAPQLQFPAQSLRARRDHKKYLMLIKAIAFLHQKQRPIRELQHGDSLVRYIEVTRDDIRLANDLAAPVLGQSADELTAPARALLGHIHALVKTQSEAQSIAPVDFMFTRKTVRDAIGWSEWQVRMHLGELEALEYVRARQGTWGKEYSYQLLADPDAAPVQFLLTDPDTLLEPAA